MFFPKEICDIQLPTMKKVKQLFPDSHIDSIEKTVLQQIEPYLCELKKDASIALMVGSRGIANISTITKAFIDTTIKTGLRPFIVPSMGSHGGGTPEGQIKILNSYGITDASMGVDIDARMDTTIIGHTRQGVAVHFSNAALEADYVIPIGRVKAHTDFHGPIESGLCKMLAIGGGKHNGCSTLHRQGFAAFPTLIPEVAKIILKNVNIPFGIAIVENAHEQTHTIEAVASSDFFTREPELLKLSKALMPRIQFDRVDILIVEEIGKDISGAGMDPNIIGRDAEGTLYDIKPHVQRIIVKGISPSSHHNGIGCGLADFLLEDAYNDMDLHATYVNCIASGNPNSGKIPIIVKNEEEGIRAALQTCAGIDLFNPYIVKIKNTLNLSEIEVSENMLSLCLDTSKFEIL